MPLWVVVMFLGLALDVGLMVLTALQLQTAADSAAMAGVRSIRVDHVAVRDNAVYFAGKNVAAGDPVLLERNDANAADGDVVIGRYNRDTLYLDPTSAYPNAVKAVARRTNTSLSGPLQLVFGRIFNKPTTEITREAIAMIGGGTGAGLIVLNETKRSAFTMGGDAVLSVGNGEIQVNSNDSQAAKFAGNSLLLDGSALNVVGDYKLAGTSLDRLPPEVRNYEDEVEVIPDPLADIPEPDYGDIGSFGGTVGISGAVSDPPITIVPGYYPGGISINNGTLILEPGIYTVDGPGLLVIGGGNVYAEGVMFYVVGTGSVRLLGNGEITLTPPDPDEFNYTGVMTADELAHYEDIAIFQARDNTAEGTILGTSNLNMEGTYYFPENHMNLGGTADKFGNQFLVNTLDVSGTSNVNIAYDGRNPAPGFDCYLVY